MKTVINVRSLILPALLGVLLAAPAMAQPGPGMGGMGGMGGGPGVQNSAPGPGGMGRGGRAMRFSQDNTPGWALMAPEEQAAHREKMLSLKTYEECKAFQAEHRSLMEARAKEQGLSLPIPRQNACDRMKASNLTK